MKREEILSQINQIFIDTLDDEDIELTETSHAAEVEGWDSLSHILLIVEIEKHFNLRFSSKEIQSWKNIGEMINSVSEKLED